MRSAVGRFGGLAALPFLSLLVPFLALPVIARVASETEWVALGVGESIGAIAALTIGYAWPLVGPARVAPAAPADARADLTASLTSRIILLAVASVPLGIVAVAIAPPGTAALALLATAANGILGLSPAWYLIGRSRPLTLAGAESLPRIAGGLAGIGVVLLTREVVWYPVILLAATVIAQTVFFVREGTLGHLRRLTSWRGGAAALRRDGHAAVAVIAGGAYSSATVAVVTAVATVPVAAVFVSADKLLKASLTAIVATTNAVQGWVAEDENPEVKLRRAARSITILAALGALGFAACSFLGPLATALLFGANLAIDTPTAVAIGLAFFAIALNTGVGRLLLIPFGLVGWVTISTLIGAAVGVPGMIVGATSAGAAGAAFGFAISEVVVVVVQVIAFLALRKKGAISGQPSAR